jgi:hypothetical protein
MRALAVCVLIVAGACHPSPEAEQVGVCTVLCRCESPLPAIQQQCVTACVSGNVVVGPGGQPDAGFVFIDAGFEQVDAGFAQVNADIARRPESLTVTDDCADCIYEHEAASCTSLIATCANVCQMQQPLPED